MQKRKMVVLPLMVTACVNSIASLGKGPVRVTFPLFELVLKPGFFSLMLTNNQATDCISISSETMVVF